MSYESISKCRCCGSFDLIEVIDLKTQPLANSYHNGDKPLLKYPLAMNLCGNCFHNQLSVVVDPNEMFSHYMYISGTTKTLHTYFEWFADMVHSDIGNSGYVLDIACNDGTQLQKFKSRGWVTHGIDPAKNLYDLSSKVCDSVVVDYFNEKALVSLGGMKYDAILAQNVFAHTNDIVYFLNCCKLAMSDNTRLYIQTSQADMIENNQFDTIYHEHLSFFSTKSMMSVCEQVGLKLISVLRTPIHGGSYIFVVTKNGKEDDSVSTSINAENDAGRYSLNTYEEYKVKVESTIQKFKDVVQDHINRGYLIVGYGAAAKGNTFLNSSEMKLHFIIDDNPMKWGLLTPGTNTMIVSPEFITQLASNTLFIPLSWNFYDEIKTKIQNRVSALSFKSLFSYKIYCYYPNTSVEIL